MWIRNIGFSAVLLVLFFVTPDRIYAQSMIVTGTVSDSETLLPLFGASVVHVNSGQGTSTDATGEYTLHRLPVGISLIRVSYTGYQSVEIQVDLSRASPYVLNIKLISGINLDQVQVTAGRRSEKHWMPLRPLI